MGRIRNAGPRDFGISFGLAGPGGSGKTMTALMMIKAFCGDRPMGLIDTESGRGERYFKYFDYKYMQLDPPYSPERYIEAMREMQEAGVAGMVIDSGTHEWSGAGGILEMHEKETGGQSSRNMVGWARVKPKHRRFIEFAKNTGVHVGITFRAVEKSKPNPKPTGDHDKIISLGFQPVTNEEASFEFDLFAMLTAGGEGTIADDNNCKTFIEFKNSWKPGLKITPEVCSRLVSAHAEMCKGAPKNDVKVEDAPERQPAERSNIDKRSPNGAAKSGLQAKIEELANAETLDEVAAIEDQMDRHRASMKPAHITALNRAIKEAKDRLSDAGKSKADVYAARIEDVGDLDAIAADLDRETGLTEFELETLFGMLERKQAEALP